eukprot:g1062.t1
MIGDHYAALGNHGAAVSPLRPMRAVLGIIAVALTTTAGWLAFNVSHWKHNIQDFTSNGQATSDTLLSFSEVESLLQGTFPEQGLLQAKFLAADRNADGVLVGQEIDVFHSALLSASKQPDLLIPTPPEVVANSAPILSFTPVPASQPFFASSQSNPAAAAANQQTLAQGDHLKARNAAGATSVQKNQARVATAAGHSSGAKSASSSGHGPHVLRAGAGGDGDQAHVDFTPKSGLTDVLARPGPPGILQGPLPPTDANNVLSLFIHEGYGEDTTRALTEGSSHGLVEAWVYGALLHREPSFPHTQQTEGLDNSLLIEPTGSPTDVVKGKLLTYRSQERFLSQLQFLNKLHGLTPDNRMSDTRRGFVKAVLKDGSAMQAVWFYHHPYIKPVDPDQQAWNESDYTAMPAKDDSWQDSVRLPKTVRPVHYDLALHVNLVGDGPEDFKFNGSVAIDMDIEQPTSTIVLHCKDLTLTSTPKWSLRPKANPRLLVPIHLRQNVNEYFLYDKHEFLVCRFPVVFPASTKLTLYLDFKGDLTDKLAGFYRSQYKKNGQPRWIATTQFQATDARRAFPCFDEPAMKATFAIRLDVPKGYHALSNMPEESARPKKNDRWDFIFQTSVKMSTYLVAFVVSDFAKVETSYISTDNTVKKVRVWAPSGKQQWGEMAVQTGAKMMQHYEKYFDIPFPLPKQDMVAVPDFSMGAMENWGLVIYREECLLYQEAEQGARDKQRVAIVVAHELAHQWFGNLVTMEWWDGLWLNEGFASYMEYEGTAHVFPEWDMRTQFFDQTMAGALAFDGTEETHAILQEVDHPDQINELFDAISYSKGASLVRMMNAFMGDQIFLSGLSNYLKKYAYGNAETEDLWSHMAAAVSSQGKNTPVAAIMNQWATQAGFPMLTARTRASGTFL